MFFNEADKLESSSMLIYSMLQMGLYTQFVWREAALLKTQIKAWINEGGLKDKYSWGSEGLGKLIMKFYANTKEVLMEENQP